MKKMMIVIMMMVMVMTNLLSAEASSFGKGHCYLAGQNKYQNTYYVVYDWNCTQYDFDEYLEKLVDEHYCSRAKLEEGKNKDIFKVTCDGWTIGYIKTSCLHN